MLKHLLDPPCVHAKTAYNNNICFYILVLLESEYIRITNALIICPIGKLIIPFPKNTPPPKKKPK